MPTDAYAITGLIALGFAWVLAWVSEVNQFQDSGDREVVKWTTWGLVILGLGMIIVAIWRAKL